jgi:hypothetical protein
MLTAQGTQTFAHHAKEAIVPYSSESILGSRSCPGLSRLEFIEALCVGGLALASPSLAKGAGTSRLEAVVAQVTGGRELVVVHLDPSTIPELVRLSAAARVHRQTRQGTTMELLPGDRVIVTGQRSATGIVATNVVVPLHAGATSGPATRNGLRTRGQTLRLQPPLADDYLREG